MLHQPYISKKDDSVLQSEFDPPRLPGDRVFDMVDNMDKGKTQ